VTADAEAEAGQGIPFDQVYGGITFVPVVVRRGYRPSARPGFAHSQMHLAAHSVRPPLLPPFQTVKLPPFQTVRLPQLQPVMLPSPVPSHAR
jgi:hypothetical protein